MFVGSTTLPKGRMHGKWRLVKHGVEQIYLPTSLVRSGKGLKNIQKNVESRIFRKRPLDIVELVDDCTKTGKTLD